MPIHIVAEQSFRIGVPTVIKGPAPESPFVVVLEDDGEIDEKERRVLERLRKNLGLSEEEAKQIEEEITQLSQNEKEYLEEYQAIIADGEITERERRLLNRLSSSLGISEERIKELEK